MNYESILRIHSINIIFGVCEKGKRYWHGGFLNRILQNNFTILKKKKKNRSHFIRAINKLCAILGNEQYKQLSK